MDKKLWNAINDLLDEASYAVTVLDRYEDGEWDDWAKTMVPNSAAVSKQELKRAIDCLEAMMPEDPETPLEKSLARAEWEEDR